MTAMTVWVDRKYLRLLAGRLEHFKIKNRNANFRCPICGDSKKSKYKARAWILDKGDHLVFHCFNQCGSKSFPWFLKYMDMGLFSEWRLEKFKEEMGNGNGQDTGRVEVDRFAVPSTAESRPGVKLPLVKFSSLPADSAPRAFVRGRSFPTDLDYRLWYTPAFRKLTNTFIPGKFERESPDEPRIVFPFRDVDGVLFGFSGRQIGGDSKVKYITILLDSDHPRLYNLDKVDLKKRLTIVEGQFDALLLDNGLASAGGSLTSELGPLGRDKDSYIIAYDNEPRSRDTVIKMEKALREGYPICIWPDNLPFKDINEMYAGGMTRTQIQNTIDNNVFRGLNGYHRLNDWKRT